jgi:hypothetical protein
MFFLGFGKQIPVATKTRNNRRIVGCVLFYAVHFLSVKIGDSFFPELLVCNANAQP